MKNKLNKKGFTLIELLAMITILSIVITIVIYVATSVMSNAKVKSYKVTINNIQRSANEYVLEELDDSIWVGGSDYQYQCVSVSNLVDAGYFDNDEVINYKNESVKVIRDAKTKVTKSMSLMDDCN